MVERRRATMPPQRRLPQPIGDLLYFFLIGAVVGAVYGHMIAVSEGAPLLGFGGLPRGVLTGVVITGVVFLFEQVWARPAMAQPRRLPFLPHLAIKTLIYFLIVLVGLAIGAGLFPAPAEAGAGLPIRRQDVLFSFAVVLAIRFIDDINHLLGQNVLRNFITGHYHRPRLEQRVFLFIDIEGSTALAERLGEFAFHRLINRFVLDITEPIVAAYAKSTDMSAMS